MSDAPVLELREVGLSLGGYAALRDVTLSFPAGESTVIMGPSGCGKTTLLKVAAGLIPPERGRVFYRGRDLQSLSERATREMRAANGFVFQDAALWENKTVQENLALPFQVHAPRLPEAERDRKIMRALERAGLGATAPQRPAQLSGGERKIVSFLRALVLDPALVFLDEPTTSIDHAMAAKISQVIHELKARGATIIAVTHEAGLATALADRLVVLDQGAVLAAGAFDEVKRSHSARVRAILSQVLGDIASYDTDLLQLLDGDGPG